jgi:ribonuclease HIII
MNESKLQTNIEALRELVQSKGWTILDEKEIQSGYQLLITDGISRIPVAFFYSGKALIQGKPGELQKQLKTWWNTRNGLSREPVTQEATQSSLVETPATITTKNYAGRPRIGLDESGKGDYFVRW